jgi:hypothetical protein
MKMLLRTFVPESIVGVHLVLYLGVPPGLRTAGLIQMLTRIAISFATIAQFLVPLLHQLGVVSPAVKETAHPCVKYLEAQRAGKIQAAVVLVLLHKPAYLDG